MEETALHSGGKLLTTRELAAYLGVPVQTVYRWRACGTAPEAIKVGRHMRYRLSSVNAWLNARVAGGRRNPAGAS
jgi:excisionase family DNA binding protein